MSAARRGVSRMCRVQYIVASPGVAGCRERVCLRRVADVSASGRVRVAGVSTSVSNKLKLCSRIASPGGWELWREKVRSEKDSGIGITVFKLFTMHARAARAGWRHCGRPGDG